MPKAVQACAGLRVVEVGSGMSGALAAMILADYGAEVVKVEPPGGAAERGSPGHRMWNRGKRSVVLDLDSPAGAADFRTLAERADVVLSTVAQTRLALAPDPRRVLALISGLGQAAGSDPVVAYDALISALVGRMSEVDLLSGAVPGQSRAAPIFTAAPVLAYGAAQLAVQGILAALLQRGRTGRGDVVRTSLLQAWTVFMMRHPLARGTGTASALPATMQRGLELCFMTAECADGRYLQMCARQDEHFRSWLRALDLADRLDDPELAGLPLGVPTMAALDGLEAELRRRMRTRTRTDWLRRFSSDYDVGADPFLTTTEYLDHPQLTANDRVVTVADPEVGPVRQLGPLAELSETPGRVQGPAPALGSESFETILSGWHERPTTTSTTAPTSLPLAGVTVLEVAHFVAGPLAGTLLAELGARVVKLEPLAGDPFRRTGAQSVKFLLGKESIALDLKHPSARAILDALVARSDVFVQSFRPRVPDRLGMGFERLAALNPRLLYVCASAYGSRGPQRDRTAFHSTPTALSGAGIVQAGQGNPPVDDSFPDPGGALAVATAVLLGLTARERTGRGQYIETTMLASAGYVLSAETVQYAGRPPLDLPDGGQHGPNARYRLYECQEGWLFLAAVRAGDRAALAAAVPSATGIDDAALADALARAFLTRPAARWVADLTDRGIAAVVVCPTDSETWLRERGLLTADEHPAFGPFWRLPAKVDLDGVRPRPIAPAALGEHSRALLGELGWTDEEIEELVQAGVIGVARQTASSTEETVSM